MIESSASNFTEFPKMARLSRSCVVSEKIDGTNAQVMIAPLAAGPDPAHAIGTFDHEGEAHFIAAGSRKRWITPQSDNFGFAAWVAANLDELRTLGPGRHFGEWWGSGIQRGYGLEKGEKRWSLFNVIRWCLHDEEPGQIETADPRIEKWQERLPVCCGLAPVLFRGEFCTAQVQRCLDDLKAGGSVAAPGFCDPEGVVAFHIAGNVGFKATLGGDGHKGFKKTIEKDEVPKTFHQKMVGV